MARKKPRQPEPRVDELREANGETRTAEVSTIAWMLAVMCGAGCELLALVVQFFVAQHPGETNLLALRSVLLFASLVTGTLSLVLGVVVRKLRRELPPTPITVFALLVGVEPFLFLLALWLRG